jgi:uncharacterized protein
MSTLVGEKVLLRIYLRGGDRAPLTPTYQLVLKAARAQGLAGCTVLQGIIGFGASGITQASGWKLIEHVPVIVEIVDDAERIGQFVQGILVDLLAPPTAGGVITLERANVMMYRQRRSESRAAMRLGPMLEPLSTLSTLAKPRVRGPMVINENGVLLRVFIGESDRDKDTHKPLYEAIVHQARQLGLAGATVLRGTEGFGANSVVHRAKLLELSADLPIVIELVDQKEKIELLVPWLEQNVTEGMITMEHVAIVLYRHESPDRAAPGPDGSE